MKRIIIDKERINPVSREYFASSKRGNSYLIQYEILKTGCSICQSTFEGGIKGNYSLGVGTCISSRLYMQNGLKKIIVVRFAGTAYPGEV